MQELVRRAQAEILLIIVSTHDFTTYMYKLNATNSFLDNVDSLHVIKKRTGFKLDFLDKILDKIFDMVTKTLQDDDTATKQKYDTVTTINYMLRMFTL